MIQRCSEVLPERNICAGIIRREQQHQHVDQSKETCGPDPDSEYERKADRQLAISDQECNRRRMGQYNPLQHRNHERIGAFLQESVDPPLKAAMQSELGSEDLILTENQEQKTDCNAQPRQRKSV